MSFPFAAMLSLFGQQKPPASPADVGVSEDVGEKPPASPEQHPPASPEQHESMHQFRYESDGVGHKAILTLRYVPFTPRVTSALIMDGGNSMTVAAPSGCSSITSGRARVT